MKKHTYVVVTPARNEEENIGHTVDSMVAQTMRPVKWIIVNDGSSDRTGELLDAAANEHDWISILHRDDRGHRKQGGGVVETVNAGIGLLGDLPWEFFVKLDADLSFDHEYFEKCLQKFYEDPELGIGGGLICHPGTGGAVCEAPNDPAFHVRGATKIYRRKCWDEIEGLLQAPGWDTIDEFKANMIGWRTRSFADVTLQHHRFTGSADGSWKNAVKNGVGSYITGYHPLFMAGKSVKELMQKPYLVVGLGLAWGYVKAWLMRTQRTPDTELIAYIRDQQMNMVFRRPSLWDIRISDLLNP